MGLRRLLRIFALLCALASLLIVCDATIGAAARRSIVINGVRYEPETVTIKRGDTVVWINKDPFPHTVTVKGVFDSREIAAGKSWTYTPRKPGEYAYICTLHPNMKGTLKVE